MAHDDTVTGDFSRSWSALLAAVAGVADEDFDQPSGCRGWLVRDLVCHLVIDAQDVLITLVTPAGTGPTADATTYWDLVEPPTGDDPLDALIPRLAAAYGDPALLKFHLDDVGSAAGRAAGLADPAALVSTKDKVLTAGDYLSAYVLEWTLHHLDLVARLPSAPRPPGQTPAVARTALERIAGTPFPAELSDTDALLTGTGRRTPTAGEAAALGGLAARLPLVLG
ncbi:maleylpyruvate isomerase N-terminal domain-containing protein [Streptomyces cellulosae]